MELSSTKDALHLFYLLDLVSFYFLYYSFQEAYSRSDISISVAPSVVYKQEPGVFAALLIWYDYYLIHK